MIEHPGQRPGHQQNDDSGAGRSGPPAEGFQRKHRDGNQDSAEREPELRQRQGLGPVPVEPVDQGDGNRQKPAEAGSEGDQEGINVELDE